MAESEAGLRVAVAALTRIAALDDDGANQHLETTGSYGRFDEPGSVQVAREALQEIGAAQRVAV